MTVVRESGTGALGDGWADDRHTLQAAIDRAAAGGGTGVVPTGMRCRTGTLEVANGVELHLECGSSLIPSDRPADYPWSERPVVLAAHGAEPLEYLGEALELEHADRVAIEDFVASRFPTGG